MADKAKVITALTDKLAGKNVSKKLIERFATRYAEKIATDEEIEAYLDDRIEDVIDAQGEGDRRANQSATAKEQEMQARLKGEKPNEESSDTEPETEIGKLTKLVQTLTQTVSGMQQERTTETINTRFETAIADMKLPPEMLVGRYPKSEEDFAGAVEKTRTDLKSYSDFLALQGNTEGGSGTKGVIVNPSQRSGEVKPASDANLDAAVNHMNIKI